MLDIIKSYIAVNVVRDIIGDYLQPYFDRSRYKGSCGYHNVYDYTDSNFHIVFDFPKIYSP